MMMYAMAAAANKRIGLLDHAFSEQMQGSLVRWWGTPRVHHKSSPRFQSLAPQPTCHSPSLLFACG
jgi:hypothetical protein